MFTRDRVAGAAIFLFALYVMWEDRVLPLGTYHKPGPGYMPLLLAIILAVPVAFGVAFYLTELAPVWLRRPVGIAAVRTTRLPAGRSPQTAYSKIATGLRAAYAACTASVKHAA